MPKWISYLKVRGSFASVGLPIPRFLAQQTYEWDNANQQWASKTHYPMGELKPERTDSWEVGLTARFLRHFNVDLSLYTAKTYNQTFDPGISPSSGYSTMYIQTGSVRNKGIELSAGYSNEWGKFGWSSNFTFSANRNEIMELMEGYVIPVINEPMTLDRLDIGGLGYARFLLKKGGSLGDLYSTGRSAARQPGQHLCRCRRQGGRQHDECKGYQTRLGIPEGESGLAQRLQLRQLQFRFHALGPSGRHRLFGDPGLYGLLRGVGSHGRRARFRRSRRQRRSDRCGELVFGGRRTGGPSPILHLFGDELPLAGGVDRIYHSEGEALEHRRCHGFAGRPQPVDDLLRGAVRSRSRGHHGQLLPGNRQLHDAGTQNLGFNVRLKF